MRREEILLNEAEWRKCRGSSPQDHEALIYWAEHYAHIKHPQMGSTLIPLRRAQLEILQVWMTERYSIVLKARQIGWSTLVALYALWLCFFWADQAVIMLSKGEREAVKLLEKATYAYDRLPAWMKVRGPKRLTKNLKKLAFDNASEIESMPSKEDPGRSSTASLVVVDEWGFLENPEEAWASIEPIADVGGRVIGLSTANGSGNFFHQFWLRAEQKLSDFKPLFYPWSANTDRDEAWYEAKKRNLPGWQLAQEYPSDPDEAFIRSGRVVFDTDHLYALATREPVSARLEWFNESYRSASFRTDDGGGPIDIWEYPKPGHAYVIGADVAEGLEYGDYSSAHVIDVKSDEVVASWHGHIDIDLFGLQLAVLGWKYNTALIGVEVNNHGITTCKSLQRLGYPKQYYRKQLDERSEKWLSKVGWSTNKSTKPLMIDDLVKAIRDNEFKLPCSATISELRTYTRNETGKMAGSPFDDRVMSLALTNQLRRYVRAPEQVDPDDVEWTMKWWRDQLKQPSEGNRMGFLNVRKAS